MFRLFSRILENLPKPESASLTSSTSATGAAYFFPESSTLCVNKIDPTSLEAVNKAVHGTNQVDTIVLTQDFPTKELSFFVGAIRAQYRGDSPGIKLEMPNSHELNEELMAFLILGNVYPQTPTTSASRVMPSR